MKVVEAKRRAERTMAAPTRVKLHTWASGPAAHASIFMDARLSSELDAAAERGAKQNREVLGLLLGDTFRAPQSSVRFTVALSQATAPVEASATHVRFDRAAFDEMARALEAQPFDYLIVGWYHSHVGLGCFMSEVDKGTQERYFRLPNQFALVLDPIRREAATFARDVRGRKGVPFALFENGREGTPDYRKPR